MTPYDILYASAKRILGLMDRSPESLTFGCLDRSFWQYRAVTDFPGGTWQQPVLGLGLLYGNVLPGNIFHRSSRLLSWIEAALLWWAGIQNRDGSFNEWYAGERSFCATAFTTWAAAATLLELEGEISPGTAASLEPALQRAGRWLCLHENPGVGNQTAASLAALTALCGLTGDAVLGRAAEVRKEQLLAGRSAEGWFPEYGGADPGYGFVTLELLADAARRSGDSSLDDAASALLRWLAPLVHPDGTVSPGAGSRGGELVLPGGIALRSGEGPALYLGQLITGALERGATPCAHSADDRYLAYFVFNSLARAAVEGFPRGGEKISGGYRPPRLFHAPESGFAAFNDGPIHLVLSLAAGGAVTVFLEGCPLYRDSGYIAVDAAGGGYATQHPGRGVTGTFGGEEGADLSAEATVPFRRWDRNRPPGGLVIPFKIAARALLLTDGAAQAFGKAVKERKVIRSEGVPLSLRRRFVVGDGELEITDSFSGELGGEIALLALNEGSFLGHSPSGRLFHESDLFPPGEKRETLEEVRRRLNAGRPCLLTTRIPLKAGGAVERAVGDVRS